MKDSQRKAIHAKKGTMQYGLQNGRMIIKDPSTFDYKKLTNQQLNSELLQASYLHSTKSVFRKKINAEFARRNPQYPKEDSEFR